MDPNPEPIRDIEAQDKNELGPLLGDEGLPAGSSRPCGPSASSFVKLALCRFFKSAMLALSFASLLAMMQIVFLSRRRT